jgi:ADP-ribosyl-[dinitrogen reductase] hydrolase
LSHKLTKNLNMIDQLKTNNKIIDALLGVAIGDALGVPYEFRSSELMKTDPCKDMVGYGTHNQAPGTWSDDSSLTFCLAESLTEGYNLKDIAKKFILWKSVAYWTAHDQVFDIGMTTSRAITALVENLENNDVEGYLATKHVADENTNGNGSLMRIMPLLFFIKGKPIQEQFDIIWDVSALTHGHIRAAMCCLVYLKVAEFILDGKGKVDAYLKTRDVIKEFWEAIDYKKSEQFIFERIIQNDVRHLHYDDLKSGGYVMESLEASLWCFLQENSYEKAVLAAVNKGHDTDTTAAITGGLAGLHYGKKGIPEYWVASLARLEDIIDLGVRLNKKALIF